MKKLSTIFLCIFCFTAYPQDHHFSLLGRWAYGASQKVVYANNKAFVANGSCLLVLNIDNPEEPSEISILNLPSGASGLAINGNYAYVAAADSGLCVVDISNPAQPVLRGACLTYDLCQTVFYSNNLVFVTSRNGVKIIDVSNPASPTQVSSIFRSTVSEVFVDGNFLYIPCNEDGMFIYDISDPANPIFKSAVQNGNHVRCVVVKEDYAYVSEGGNFVVYNATDKTALQQVSSIEGPLKSMVYKNDTIYGIGHWKGLKIIDVKNPLAPSIIGGQADFYYSNPVDLEIIGHHILVADSPYGIRVLDATNLNNLAETGSFITGSYPSEMLVEQGLVYLCDLANGLFILDASDKSSIHKLSMAKDEGEINHYCLAKNGHYVYLGTSSGLYVVDVQDAQNPSISKKVELGWVKNIEARGSYLYVTGNGGMHIYDITDPINPTQVSTLLTQAQAMAIQGDYAYVVTNNEAGFHVVNITDPANPTIESYFAVGDISFARDILVSGNYVYAVGHGLMVVDISDPQNPQKTSYQNGSFWYSVALVGNDVYIGHEDGVTIVDVTDPANLSLVDDYEVPYSYAATLVADGPVVYYGHVLNGLYVLNNDFPTGALGHPYIGGLELFQNYPNPFSQKTTIKYQLPEDGQVTLKIYDLLGHEVSVLVDGFNKSGFHMVEWDNQSYKGQELIYKLTFGNGVSKTCKMLAY